MHFVLHPMLGSPHYRKRFQAADKNISVAEFGIYRFKKFIDEPDVVGPAQVNYCIGMGKDEGLGGKIEPNNGVKKY